jgi:hypothetical protein
MSDKKNSAVQKALAELGIREQPVLAPEQEDQLATALDPELQRLQDIMNVFTPKDS